MTIESVPHDVEHWIIWSRVPIVHPSNERIDKLGLWGFSGTEGCEGATLPEGITPPPPPTQEEADVIGGACQQIEKCVRSRWPEAQWESAWFMNPPVSGPSSPRRQKLIECIPATAKYSGPCPCPCLRTTKDTSLH